MDTVTIIRVVAGCLFLCIFAAEIAFFVFLSGVLSKCAPQSRTMRPGMVWLILIPLFNLIWMFVLVSAIADSLGNEFRMRSIPLPDPKPGNSIGMAWAATGIGSFVPGVIFVHLILWIIYWRKIAGFSEQLDFAAVAVPANPNM